MTEPGGNGPQEPGSLSSRGALLAGLAAVALVLLAAIGGVLWPQVHCRLLVRRLLSADHAGAVGVDEELTQSLVAYGPEALVMLQRQAGERRIEVATKDSSIYRGRVVRAEGNCIVLDIGLPDGEGALLMLDISHIKYISVIPPARP